MPSYASQIPVEDRWAIILYVRALQRSRNATMKDVPEELEKTLEAGQARRCKNTQHQTLTTIRPDSSASLPGDLGGAGRSSGCRSWSSPAALSWRRASRRIVDAILGVVSGQLHVLSEHLARGVVLRRPAASRSRRLERDRAAIGRDSGRQRDLSGHPVSCRSSCRLLLGTSAPITSGLDPQIVADSELLQRKSPYLNRAVLHGPGRLLLRGVGAAGLVLFAAIDPARRFGRSEADAAHGKGRAGGADSLRPDASPSPRSTG